jgi:hypothetical protein
MNEPRAAQGPQSLLKKAIKGDWKGKLSLVLYVRIERLFAGSDN